MSWRTHPAILGIRSLARKCGLTRLASRILRSDAYEKRFHDGMIALIRPGDIIWDVGANVGHYAEQFSELVGPAGRVYAIEPSPVNLRPLRDRLTSRKNVTVIALGLGDREAIVPFVQGEDSLGATSRVTHDRATPTESDVRVEIRTGDQLEASGGASMPCLIKIDTEGYELEVLRGLDRILASPAVRAVCVEIHFKLLSERGLRGAPAEIERILRERGFALAWPDSSHVIATRLAACAR